MGTRHIIAVYADGEYKVANYGQWDGYPEGQGTDCLKFLRERMNDQFPEKVKHIGVMDREELRKLFRQYGAKENGNISCDNYDRFAQDHPEFSRDTGSDILDLIQNREPGMKLLPDLEFVADGLFCEWAYVIDLDIRTFEVYEGFQKEPLTENDRFYFLEKYSEDGYHPAKLVAAWSLDSLPTEEEFLKECGEARE